MEDDGGDDEDPHPWKVATEVKCKDSPEVVKFKPGTSLLAIQCNDGYVYLVQPDGPDRCFLVAPPQKKHVTADMAWGSGPSDGLLFASSACREGDSGFHKAYDIVKNKVVTAFDADKQACSSLTLDSLGERLFIATEGPGRTPSYFLRQYDVRSAADRRAVQQVELEPFAGSPDRNYTDINSLSLSPDGIYIAVGRTDNWVDVYDARMLQRGPLHNYAHEGGGLHKYRAVNMGEGGASDEYGVVKTQWVDSYPFGFGLVSGGADGCVRLWDAKLASSDPVNGRILAQSDDHVATFSLGDIFQGEVPIILGDTFGRVTLFDFPWGRNS
ncbi:WD40-repeat-containing domain protein [Dichomitus squalens]|uniref:WD40-repeat-containing domain protein n=1 Tax=Dichomitus squalens TaxID=114155 RepID=A0A4Q9N7F9_9APHY|nr:WD40-repeat-containing domain protein [Dichomitus squalens]